jgi:transposase
VRQPDDLGSSRALSTIVHASGCAPLLLTVERLPGYAPDLNPVERVWGNVKAAELANLCADTTGQARAAAQVGLNRVSSSSRLCFAFLAHTGLSL